jgi:hemerythrin superfamily protein
MTTTTDALELLREQHAEVEKLFEQIEQADGDQIDDLFAELADKLAAHATIEEQLFYPAVLSEETAEDLLESTEEHLAAKRVLADMLELDPENEHFAAKLHVLKEEVLHHAHVKEEGTLFRKVENMLTADERTALGSELLAMFEDLMTQEPRMLVPSETAEAAPLDLMAL